MGFMGMSGSEIAALFLAPEFRGRGGGRRLVRHAQELRGELTVDVNEQNVAARRFYEACGFVVEQQVTATSVVSLPVSHIVVRIWSR